MSIGKVIGLIMMISAGLPAQAGVAARAVQLTAQMTWLAQPGMQEADVHGQGTTQEEALEALVAEADARFAAGAWEAAAESYRKITAGAPTNGRAWFRLGYALHTLGRLDEAIEVHRKAAEFEQFAPVAHFNVGCVLALQGKSDAAFEALGRAVKAGFKDTAGAWSDADLISLRADSRFAALFGAAELQPRRQFDFWVGEWEVFNAQGKKVGDNVIELVENGHLIMENWHGCKGGTGRSMNFYDPSDQLWKQVWVWAAGDVVHYEGKFSDGAMRLVGTAMRADGQREKAEATYTLLPEGKVRQFIRHSRDGGETWYIYFDGTYVRKTE